MDKYILIVDDDVTLQKILKTRLTNEGYKVVCASDGIRALHAIEKQKPHLIICDVMMPYMNGFELYNELKKSPQTKNIPVLIITSLKDLQDSFLLIGADAFIAKPFDPQHLISRAKQLFSGLKIQSIKIPKQNQALHIPKEANKWMVLLAKDIDDLTKSLTVRFSKELYDYFLAQTGQELIEKAVELHPGIIIMNVRFGETPATEMIKALNEFPELKSKILLYSYFMKEDMAINSELNYFYTTHISDIAKESRLSVSYLGAFSKKMSKDNLLKSIEKHL